MNYPVILADPAWNFENWGEGASRNVKGKYSTMTTDAICALPIPATNNAALFLWACWPKLPDALRVIDAWGFEYRTIAWVWTKLNRNSMGLFTGMGCYTRANTEPCLLAVRGSMPVAAHDIQSVIMTPIQEHSRKPDDQYRKIEALYPDGPYLEMFARRTRPGWHVWGNEVMPDVQIGVSP